MITIYYPRNSRNIDTWKENLDRIFMNYELKEGDDDTVPKLTDGGQQFEGIPNIESYLESLERFVAGWYEDRCDRYEFDPDAPITIKGIST